VGNEPATILDKISSVYLKPRAQERAFLVGRLINRKETSMKNILKASLIAGAALVLSGPAFAASKSEEAREKTVALSSVPKAAMDAAKQALGADPTEAKVISGTKPRQYELEARNAAGKEVAVHVRGDGTIVKRETETEASERHER
jgi:hypothetical protein